MSSTPTTRLPALHTRIRRRRLERGLTGTDLAVRAGISTSYVSLIENGAKVPDEEAAARLARALGDDEPLYRAWARAARMGAYDLAILNEFDAIARTPAFASLLESGEELPRVAAEPHRAETGTPTSDLAARLREVAFRLAPFTVAAPPLRTAEPPPLIDTVCRVPVLSRGAEPSDHAAAAPDALVLDRRLLDGDGPFFAYEVTHDDERRLRGLAAPGDHVVLRTGGSPTPDRICAVRVGGRVRLSRVVVADGVLVLLPGEGETAFEAVPLAGADPSELLAGTHVLLLRR